MRRMILLILGGVLLPAAACSDDTAAEVPGTPSVAATTTAAPAVLAPPTPAAPATATTPAPSTVAPVRSITVTHDGGVSEIRGTPGRIAALSATHVEMLFALGVGDRVIAGDAFSNYPPDGVADLEVVDSFNLNVEAVIDLDPDLVILSFDPGGAVDGLEAVGIPTLLLGTAADLEQVYEQIRVLGSATGAGDAAADLIAGMAARIDDVIAAAADRAEGVSFYHESDPFSFYTPSSESFIGKLYQLLGMVNIADAATDFSSGFPQLSAEFIISSNPDIIFLASFGEAAETVAGRDGWDTMSAVANGHIVVLDYDTASRWGPRVVDLLEAIAAGVMAALPEATAE